MFLAPEKPAKPAVLSQRVEAVKAASEQLVRVSLMAGVPHNLVGGDAVGGVHRHRQLDRPEVRTEVAARPAHLVQDRRAHLVRQLVQLLVAQSVQVGRPDDLAEVAVAAVHTCPLSFNCGSFRSSSGAASRNGIRCP